MAIVIEEAEAPLVCEDRPRCLSCSAVLNEPYIRCYQCERRVVICLQCFAKGVEPESHKNDHGYEIMRTNFSILEETWNADEEVCLLEAVGDCGLGNWVEVAKQVQSKSSDAACEQHYMKCYIDQPQPALLLPASEDPPRPPSDSVRSTEMAGYMAFREDFDVEYDNYAELDIKDIDFDACESELLRELQFAAVEIYLSRLQQRFYRKQIVRKYGLVNIKKWQLAERRHSKLEKETRDNLRPFARLLFPEHHEMLIQALLMERFLKTEIVALQEYRAAGVKTRKGAEVYERLKKHREEERGKRRALDDVLAHLQDERACQAWLQRQATMESGRSLAPVPMPGLGRKPAARLDISGTPSVELLSLDEREMCSTLRLLPNDYLNYKATLIKENEKHGFLRLAQARSLVRIDVNKTRKMFNFFIERGWIIRPDD